MPDEWRDGAGAMWGHDRKMPVADDSVLPMDMRAFHQDQKDKSAYPKDGTYILTLKNRQSLMVEKMKTKSKYFVFYIINF